MSSIKSFHRRFAGPAVLAALLSAAGCARHAAAPETASVRHPVKVVLQTDWYAQPEHGGFYEALAEGLYRRAGLDVVIRQGGPSIVPAQMVATGRADFAIGRSDDVIIAASRGIPLVMVGALMQRDPQAIMFHKESGIHGFRDLNGRNIMAVPGSAFIPIMERTYHIKVAITPSDFGMSRFLADKNFVQQCFITNEPYYVRRHGAHVGVLLLSDSGFSPYRVWYTRREMIRDHPDVVRAFTAASIRGWHEYLLGNRAAADALIAARNPKMTPDFMRYSVHAMRQYGLVTGDPAQGETIGQIRRSRIATQIRQLESIHLLERPVTVDEVFDPHFLPAAVEAPAAKP